MSESVEQNGVPKGYELQMDGKTLRKQIRSHMELRSIYGTNPISKEQQRKYHAFYVSLPIMETPFSTMSRRDGVFTHAQNGQQAANIAALFWNDRFRRRKMLFKNDFPKLCMTDPKDHSTAPVSIKIDDDDLDKFWKDVKKMPHEVAGDPQYPISFMTTNGVDVFEIDKSKIK